MKLLLATTNPGKLEEISRFLSDVPIKLVSLKDVGITDSVEETGKTFEENAILKAKFYAQKSGMPTLADDGGAEIDALSGAPGVRTRRWIHNDRDSTDEEIIAYVIEKLSGLSQKDRGMQLRVVLALALPNGVIHTATAKIRGIIADKPTNDRYAGFPFRSLLFIPELGKFYNHTVMNAAENETYNHRKKALEELKPIIRKLLTNK